MMTQTHSMRRLPVLTLALVAGLLAAPAEADRYDALRADAEIESGVLVAAIGDIIRDNCPGIEQRRARTLFALQGLVSRAQSLGYSLGEIRAYVESDAEKARVTEKARDWFAQQGVDPDDSGAVCAQAGAEIAADSRIGRLMRQR